MNGLLDRALPALIALNVAAVCVWLASLRRWHVVVGRPDVSRAAGALSRARSGLLSGVTPVMRSLVTRLGSWIPARAATTRGVQLDEWIEEVEQKESRPAEPVESSGSESWWRAWAATGGKLPGAAGSCRDDGEAASGGGRAG